MSIKSIICCCGQGLGSSMIVSMNVETALSNLGVSGVSVSHTSLSEAASTSADLYVIGRDLEAQATNFENKIILQNILDMNELQEKLKELF